MSSSSGRACRVLIVDDNPDLLASLVFALTTAGGFEVETASNGVEGLERALTARPDCMVIDVKMPEINGHQLVRVLRGDPATADIPLVILSALVQEQDQMIGIFAGADRYLTKPTKPLVLIEAIQQAVALSAEDRERRLRALAEEGGRY